MLGWAACLVPALRAGRHLSGSIPLALSSTRMRSAVTKSLARFAFTHWSSVASSDIAKLLEFVAHDCFLSAVSIDLQYFRLTGTLIEEATIFTPRSTLAIEESSPWSRSYAKESSWEQIANSAP